MLTTEDIRASILDLVEEYDVKKISVFGSYADGTATETSDVDILVEFLTKNVSLFKLYEFQEKIVCFGTIVSIWSSLHFFNSSPL